MSSAFEKLYKSESFEEVPLKKNPYAREQEMNTQIGNDWLFSSQEPKIELENHTKIHLAVEKIEEFIVDEGEELIHHLPLITIIITSLLLVALVGFNIYWLKSLLKNKETRDSNSDIEETEDSEDPREVSSILHYENELKRIPDATSNDNPEKENSELTDSDSSMSRKSSDFEDSDHLTEDESSEHKEKDTISQQSILVDLEIETYQAKDVITEESTEREDPEEKEEDTTSVQFDLEIETFEAKDVTTQEAILPMKEKNIKCLHCEKRFHDQNGMKTHILSKHKHDSRNNSIDLLQNSLGSSLDSHYDSGMETGVESILENTDNADSIVPRNHTRKSTRKRSGGKNKKKLPLSITCSICNGLFATENGLSKHTLDKH